jgi:hypothetical protein
MGTYVTGLHVGDVSGAHSAGVTIQRVTHRPEHAPKNPTKEELRRAADYVQDWAVVAVERFDRPTVPELVERLQRRHAVRPLCDDTALVVDVTAGGRQLWRSLAKLPGFYQRVPVALDPNSSPVGLHVPLRELRRHVVPALQAERLKVPEELPEREIVLTDINEVVEATDETENLSALAVGLALAVWHAMRTATGDPWVSEFTPVPGSEGWRRREQWKQETGQGESRDPRDEWLREKNFGGPF